MRHSSAAAAVEAGTWAMAFALRTALAWFTSLCAMRVSDISSAAGSPGFRKKVGDEMTKIFM